MIRRFVAFVAVILICFFTFRAHGQFIQDRSELAPKCNLSYTREAREILEEEFYDLVEDYGYTLPTDCPFHRANDIFKKFDSKLTLRRGIQTFNKCNICPKVFENQGFLDKHFINKHVENLDQRGVCLGDYCDLLGCDSWYQKHLKEGCNDFALSQRAVTCKNLMSKCFSVGSSPVAGELLQLFTQQYCEKLNCANLLTVNPNSQRKKKSSKVIYTVLLLFLLICVAMFYFLLVFLKKEEIFGSASRLRGRSRKGFFKSIWDYLRKKQKVKAY